MQGSGIGRFAYLFCNVPSAGAAVTLKESVTRIVKMVEKTRIVENLWLIGRCWVTENMRSAPGWMYDREEVKSEVQ